MLRLSKVLLILVSLVWIIPTSSYAQKPQSQVNTNENCDVPVTQEQRAERTLVNVPSSACTFTITSALGGKSLDYPSSTGQQTGRMLRNGNASMCGTQKATPSIASQSSSFVYDIYSFTNKSATARCVTVEFQANCGSDIFIAAYSSFNAATPAAGYLADPGSSPSGGITNMGFTVGANQTFKLVVSEVISGAGCTSYTLKMRGLPLFSTSPTHRPLGVSATSGSQSGRLSRDGVASTCANPKTSISQINQTPTPYTSYKIYNNNAFARCIEVTVHAPNCTNPNYIFAVAYTQFSPTQVTNNYVADGGGSPEPTSKMEFTIPARTSVDIVVSLVDPSTTCNDYRVIVSGLECPYGTFVPLAVKN